MNRFLYRLPFLTAGFACKRSYTVAVENIKIEDGPILLAISKRRREMGIPEN
jgi:hypothetical protein